MTLEVKTTNREQPPGDALATVDKEPRMPAYLIVEHIITDAAKFEEYRAHQTIALRHTKHLNLESHNPPMRSTT